MTYTKKDALQASLDYFGGDDLAAKAFVDKYALQQDGVYYELTPDGMHARLAREFARIESKYPQPLSYSAIKAALDHFKYIVPGGSPMYGIGNPYAVVSLSNCVALDSPEDNISSIYERGRDAANLFKRRCGVGIDISTLRPSGSPVTNSAKTSSGAWSFAELYSFVSKHTAQQGRRGAMMITLNVKHPDIQNFVTMKRDLTKITGANISVMITDQFMEAVKDDDWWYMQFDAPATEPRPIRLTGTKFEVTRVRARELWRLICQTATDTAEPGIIFIDTYRANLPLDYYPQYRSVCVNPCSEILLAAYDSCRLLSMNLRGFVTNPHSPDAGFDWTRFDRYIHVATRLLDDLVDLEMECLQRIIDTSDTDDERQLFTRMYNTAQGARRTGLGTHGLADALAAMGLKYDDPGQSRDTIHRIYATLRDEAYRESIYLGHERGVFPDFNWELEKECPFLRRLPEDLYEAMRVTGRRNGALLTNAPTGTVSIMSQTSSGIEPVFANHYTRRRKLSGEQSGRVDFTDATNDQFEEHTVNHRNVEEYIQRNGDGELPNWFITAPEIDWMERVRIQGVIQSYIDHGISSTINLPKGTGVEVIEKLYEAAHAHGLKGLTVYVDGSRDGILITPQQKWYERPPVLPCDIHHVDVSCRGVKQQFIVLVSLKEGKPFEIFGGEARFLTIPSYDTHGQITRYVNANSKNRYELEGINGGTDLITQDLGHAFQNNEYSVVSRLISLALRNGTALVDIVDQLLKEQNVDFFAYTKVVARVLKRYIADGTRSSIRCESCGSKSLRFEGGCVVCTDCGYSGCS